MSKLDLIQSRLDSDFYSKGNLYLESKIKALTTKKIEAIGCKLDCSAFYPSITGSYSFGKGEVPFIRVNEIQEGLIQITDSTAYLPNNILEDNKNTIAIGYPNDIVIAKGGNTLAKVCILSDLFPKYALCRDVILIRTQNIPKKIIYGMWTFLNSKYGYKLMIRTASQTGQPHLTIPNILNLSIPMWDDDFLMQIENCYKESIILKNKSKSYYLEAENFLLMTLGLKKMNPFKKMATVKTYSDILINKRLDAEYYQPKYEELFNTLKRFAQDNLANIVTINKSIEPGSEEYQESGIPFIRVANLSENGISDTNIYLDKISYAKTIRPLKDTILLSKDGSVGVAYKVSEDMNVITSGAILHLSVFNKDYLPDYLTLVLNSIVVRMQAERDSGGSIIQHWKPSEIEKVVIPKLDISIQREISNKVQESFRLSNESKQLLDLAKTAVELAIDGGEANALEIINSTNYEIN